VDWIRGKHGTTAWVDEDQYPSCCQGGVRLGAIGWTVHEGKTAKKLISASGKGESINLTLAAGEIKIM
jgi:hypothetical protein